MSLGHVVGSLKIQVVLVYWDVLLFVFKGRGWVISLVTYHLACVRAA